MTPYMPHDYQSQREADLEEATHAMYRARNLIDSAARMSNDNSKWLEIDHAIVDELQFIDKIGEKYQDSMFPGMDYHKALDYAKEQLGEDRANYIEYQASRLQGEEARKFDEWIHLVMYLHNMKYGGK